MSLRDAVGRLKIAFSGSAGLKTRSATFAASNFALAPPLNDVYLEFPNACVIRSVTLLTTGGTGSCVVDLRKDTYANWPPTSGDSICGASKPTISSGTKYQDTTFTGWTTAINAGDIIAVTLESSTTFRSVTVQIEVEEL